MNPMMMNPMMAMMPRPQINSSAAEKDTAHASYRTEGTCKDRLDM